MLKVQPKKMSKYDRMHWRYGVDAMKMFEYDLHNYAREFNALPAEWHGIWEDDDRRDSKRVKVTASFDADVVKFFKGLGPGYQHRMNRVLRAFMHFRLAKLIEGPDTTDFVLRPERVLERFSKKPEWGDTEAGHRRMMGEE
ncbi:BrnA antitoxin family protein [Octadecabacter sp. SW4]|uniref:BrnA antitoxin family protein n=1 Tax=Octadecabacter sp. SW4 TaxID=2602067 RepID=UPI0018DA09E3|nr:BrnA antitoxin family protein [Octadecabacter sp. SW4]